MSCSHLQAAPAVYFEAFAADASYIGELRGWIDKDTNEEDATGGAGGGAVT